MKKSFPVLLPAVLLVLFSCSKNQETVTENPDFIPPLHEIRYINHSTTFWGFGFSGVYRFTSDVAEGRFHVTVTKTDLSGIYHDKVQRFTFNKDYLPELIEFFPDNGEGCTSVRLYYEGQRLARIDELVDHARVNSSNVIHTSMPGGGRKMLISPYLTINGRGKDTLSHWLLFDNQERVIQTGDTRGSAFNQNHATRVHSLYYNATNSLIRSEGADVWLNRVTGQKDSLWVIRTHTRVANENPVLFNYFEKLYGPDYFKLLTLCEDYSLSQEAGITRYEFLRLPGQYKSSETQIRYDVFSYKNGVFQTWSGSSRSAEITLDAQRRLLTSKNINSLTTTPPSYYTWEVVYK